MVLFDVDETLTSSRQPIKQDMVDILDQVIGTGIHIGIVSGSDFSKVSEQIGDSLIKSSQYCFTENGLLAMK